jgi:hypothetical protein
MPASQSQLLPNIAVFLGSIPGLIGINGLLRPAAVIEAVQFPIPTATEPKELAFALTRLLAARNTVISMTLLAIWYRGDRKLLGWAMLLLGSFPVVDAMVSYNLIGGGLGNHLPVVPVALGLGVALLR